MTNRAEHVRSQFETEGLSIAEWAREKGFNPRTVYAVLRGEVKAKRGIGHRIAVELGLKEKPLAVIRQDQAA